MATLKPTDECIIKRMKCQNNFKWHVFDSYNVFGTDEYDLHSEYEFIGKYSRLSSRYKMFNILIEDGSIKKILYNMTYEIKNIPLWRKRNLSKIQCGSCIHKHLYKLTGKCKESYKWRH